jgi:hypothetical protein
MPAPVMPAEAGIQQALMLWIPACGNDKLVEGDSI